MAAAAVVGRRSFSRPGWVGAVVVVVVGEAGPADTEVVDVADEVSVVVGAASGAVVAPVVDVERLGVVVPPSGGDGAVVVAIGAVDGTGAIDVVVVGTGPMMNVLGVRVVVVVGAAVVVVVRGGAVVVVVEFGDVVVVVLPVWAAAALAPTTRPRAAMPRARPVLTASGRGEPVGIAARPVRRRPPG